MQIVIDVSEETIRKIKNELYCGIDDPDLYKAMENGKPLPKGHGRLIDADKMTSELLTIDSNYAFLADWTLQVLDAQPIVIEAEED